MTAPISNTARRDDTVYPGQSAATTARLSATAETWKRKLLDLSKRNRALNFKVQKVSTVTIVDEQPAEVFRQLYIKERAMKFKSASDNALESSREISAAATATETTGYWAAAEEETDAALQIDFVPYDAALLDEKHRDEWLQASAGPDALDKSLRRLDEQARLSIEEQGVNTLFMALGMLQYTESADSEQTFRAPLVLLPVVLLRKSARSGYTVQVADDEPMVNPALAEYLRRDHGIELPLLPESSVMPDDYDLQTVLQEVTEKVAGKNGWAVKTDIYIAPFSFQKFVMYKDLEANAEALKDHRLIRQLTSRTGGEVIGLPGDVRDLDLDSRYPPEATYQVVDADSTQLRAIAASAHGHDLVVEGPPGTGKSQTITNLVAQALSKGKSVLFVAEKMAALSVVHDRLVRAGLGEFCLELHSTKANKREVMKQVAAALDASLQTPAVPTLGTQRLPSVRATLTDYAVAVHSPNGALGVSAYRGYGELGKVWGAPKVEYRGVVDNVTTDQVDQAVRDLADLTATSSLIGAPGDHPWRDSSKTFLSEGDLDEIERHAQALLTQLETVDAHAEAVRAAFNLPPITTLGDVATAVRIASVMTRSPGAPLEVLASDAWNQAPAEATALIRRGRDAAALRERVAAWFGDDVMSQEHASDIAYVEDKSEGFFSFLAVLNGRYRAIRRRWIGYRRAGYAAPLIDQAAAMKQVDQLVAEHKALDAESEHRLQLFGPLWEGHRSDWDVLDSYVRWVVDFRTLCVQHGLAGKALEVASRKAPDIAAVGELNAAAGLCRNALVLLGRAVGWPDSYMLDEPLAAIRDRGRSLAENIGKGPGWAAFEGARQAAAKSIAGELIPLAMKGGLRFDELAPAFLRAFWMKWVGEVVRARPLLAQFSTLTHEQRVREFRELDQLVLKENRAGLVRMLRQRLQDALQKQETMDEMPYLRREITKQRGLSPLRRTFHQTEHAIRSIKPCFMMSPLTVAQLLKGSSPTFDLVIFDEASQLPAEDAAGAIIRGRQLVVVGDPKQLPPTNFFSVSAGATTSEVGDDGQPLFVDSESILEEYMAAGVPMSRLKWHYRSAHESLISFSNISFYDADLYTFPSVETGSHTYGLQFEYLRDGIYAGAGLNAVEAARVAREVMDFAREQTHRRERGEQTQTLGVGTFNMRQQLAIQDELEQMRREDPSVEPFFNRSMAEPFFVKNLENIQGDERDVIFISVTYGKAADGRLRYNFGPLNGENGWRRLNVLTTRARQRMKVFSSIRGDEINAAATTSRGANLLREFLIFAEHGRLQSVAATLAADADSPFEREVQHELTNRGITVVPQIGIAGYKIDLGVLDAVAPGKFLCGIECDGVAYHSAETARDRDRLRQQVLEARGWTIHRVWSTDWFKDRRGQIDRLLKLIDESRARARSEAEAEEQARVRLLADAAMIQEAERQIAIAAATELPRRPMEAPYERPIAVPYRFAAGDGTYAGRDLLTAPESQVTRAVVSVVEAESPIHETDLYTRVAGMWSTRAGARIQARLVDTVSVAQRSGMVQRRGEFVWSAGSKCQPRSRASTKIPGDRIAPEEYEATIALVLAGGHGFSRPQLITEVRAVLGYSRTGAALESAIDAVIAQLLAQGRLGEGSNGIRSRQWPTGEL